MTMTRKPCTTGRMFWLGGLAVLGGGAAGVSTAGMLENADPAPAPDAQLAMLERRVDGLQARADRQANVQAALTPPADGEWLPNYLIECAAPWRELGAIGQGLWGCQAPEPLPDGFYPNCNLTTSVVKRGLTAQAYFEAAISGSSELVAARKFGGRALRLRRQAAYEGSFEHQITGTSLRVLAMVVVQDDRVFAISCSAPPAVFESFVPRFREIASSFALGA